MNTTGLQRDWCLLQCRAVTQTIAHTWMRTISTASKPCQRALYRGASTPYVAAISFSPMCRYGICNTYMMIYRAQLQLHGADTLVIATSCCNQGCLCEAATQSSDHLRPAKWTIQHA